MASDLIRTPIDRRRLMQGGALAALALATGLPAPAHAQEKIKVAAIYTVPVEQQWVSRIHKAANAAKDTRRHRLRLLGERRQHRL